MLVTATQTRPWPFQRRSIEVAHEVVHGSNRATGAPYILVAAGRGSHLDARPVRIQHMGILRPKRRVPSTQFSTFVHYPTDAVFTSVILHYTNNPSIALFSFISILPRPSALAFSCTHCPFHASNAGSNITIASASSSATRGNRCTIPRLRALHLFLQLILCIQGKARFPSGSIAGDERERECGYERERECDTKGNGKGKSECECEWENQPGKEKEREQLAELGVRNQVKENGTESGEGVMH